MRAPDPHLTEAFGTDKIAAQWDPTKGGLPLAALLGGLLLYHGMKRGVDSGIDDMKAEHNMARLAEADRNAGTVSALRGGAPLDPMGMMLYQNERADSVMHKGAALHAIKAGRALAKQAGIGGLLAKGVGMLNRSPDLLMRGAQAAAKPVVSRLPGPGLKTKALIGATALGGGLLAAKAGKKVMEYGLGPSQEHRQGGHSAQLPSYVNQFGVPVL